LSTGVWKNPFADVAAPATLGASGGLQRAAGVSRAVTGVFSGVLASDLPAPSSSTRNDGNRSRVWFCAIEGRACGPYNADEMLALAHKGKVRTSTLIWRPGASGWKPLRAVDAFDVAWLLDAARQRKHAEQRAEHDLLRRRGIVPVRLERRTVRSATSTANAAATTAGDGRAVVGAPQGAVSGDVVFDVGDGAGALPVVEILADVDDASRTPFVWRAPTTASHSGLRRPARAGVLVVVVGAGVGVVIAAAVLVAAGALPLP
jgi:hypothetical protein